MDPTLALHSRDLAMELYALLREIDPARWRDDLAEAASARLASIEERLARLLAATWPTGEAVQARLLEMQQVLRDHAPGAELGDLRAHWMACREALQPVYEALAASLREWDIHVPSLRPTNYARNALHAVAAVGILALLGLALDTPTRMRVVAFGAAGIAWTLEATRRVWPRWNDFLMGLFGPTSHPHERHRVNSATWYVTALAVLSLTGSAVVGAAAVAILGFGDPAAALVGRRWGRVKLLHGRTLEGSLAFVLAGGLAALAALRLFHPGLGWPLTLALAGAATVAGAAAEAVVRHVDDNLAIPLASGTTTWLVLASLGIV